MNERIRELVLEAEHGNYGRMAFGEKLAELIVRECASQCTTEGPFGAEVVWGTQFNKKILTHFGVEK